MIVYSTAIRRLCREHGLTWAECVDRFGDRLVYVQCNVVTTESVAALDRNTTLTIGDPA